jgi:alcohol dehydrogenase
VIAPFELGRIPRIVFGAGSRGRLPALAASFGPRVLLVTGRRSLRDSVHGRALFESFAAQGLDLRTLTVAGEPSPEVVDDAVREHRATGIDAVVGIGGGSVLDAAKAVAGLLVSGRSVMDHLEEVGAGLPYAGPSTPFLAAPTTAGTGSETSRNAVLSRTGAGAFKRSFRHEDLVARWAVVDPDLLETCPRALAAADGMDALTQLLESYVARRASALTDALAERGLAAARDGLVPGHEGTRDPRETRAAMAYAAMLSGITLAHAGLGIVHGLSSPLGARHGVPHGVACGTLLAAATAVNVRALRARDPEGDALRRYARAGAILEGAVPGAIDVATGPERLVERLEDWTRRLELPRLGAFGVGADDITELVASSGGGSTKTNPIALEGDEVAAIVAARV